MHSTFSFTYPWYWFPVCVLLGLLYAAALYRSKKSGPDNDLPPGINYLLATCRAIVVTVLAALLLEPLLSWRYTETNKPVVALLQDNSESIRYHLSSADSAEYFKKWNVLAEKLAEKYEVVRFAIGSSAKMQNEFPLSDKSTNISDAIEEINDRYYNQNLGAIVLASDGIFNQGVNPVYPAAQAPYAIYTIALGDTTIPNDIRISNVLHNKIAYLNDQFSVRVELEATHLAGKSAVVSIASIVDGKAVVESTKPVNINSNAYFQVTDFILPAKKVGISRYRIEVSQVPGESTFRNNARDIFVEVLDGRQKIALIANSPHPDITALKQTITSNKNYQLDVFYAAEFNAKLNDYNLVIMHQLPSGSNKIPAIVQQCNDLKKPMLWIIGSQTDFNALLQMQQTVSGSVSPGRFNDVTAKFNSGFSAFTLSDPTQNALMHWPPLQNFFGDYQSNPAAQVLFRQKINNVETDYPLIAVNDNGGKREGVICGEGLWRWRLYSFEQNKNHEAFNELFNKLIQFLAVKGDKRPFRINLPKNIFSDNENITFDAQLYNSNFEMVNTPDVDLKLFSEEGKEYPFKMNKTENYYTLNAGFLPVGNYSYSATTKLGNNTYKADGKFSIAPLQLEELRTVADHQLLFQLADQHHGVMYNPANFEKLADELLSKNKLKPILFDSFQTNAAINLKWIFFLLLSLLSMEWLVRKYLGGY
ncbi:MAG: hypothetical protein U0T73_01595 [Chitinophagales bacterium]